MLLLLASPAAAQTNDEINAGLQLDFSPPGARSLGLGNAFVGLADDTTAAWANPAGLLWLSQTEISLEGRYRRDVQRFPDTGNATGAATGLGLDTASGLTFRESSQDNTGLAFASFVTELSPRLRLAVFRHELARFESTIDSQGPFIRQGNLRSRLAAVQADLDLEVEQYGVALAWALSPSWWVGGSLGIYDFRMNALTRRYSTVDPASPISRPIFDAVATVPINERDRHVQNGDDEAVGMVLGLLWRSPNRAWSAGLVHRTAPEFDLDYRFEWGLRSVFLAAGDRDGDGVIDQAPNLNFVDPGVEAALSGTTTFELPDVWSVGLAFRPSDTLTFSLQVDRTSNSNLEPEANILFNVLGGVAACGSFDADGRAQDPRPCQPVAGRLEKFHVPDTTEPHLGVEWVVDVGRPLALRAGVWHQPDHRMVFLDPKGAPEDRLGARFRPGEDTTHGTFGLGLAADDFQIDLAIDLSSQGDVLSLSTVYRF